MIEFLIAVWAAKYRHGFSFNDEEYDPIDRALEPGAGIEYAPPQRERPILRVVK